MYDPNENLLLLDGSILVQAGGYWVKIEARQTKSSETIPHGIRYSLTLHAPDGSRILGYDNAHSPSRKTRKTRYYDHKHPAAGKRSRQYEFQSGEKLLTDFFADVDRVLKAKGLMK